MQETGAANFLLIRDGHIVTRSLDSTFLHGVTRDSLLTMTRDMGFKVEERVFDVAEMLDWVKTGEAALSGTAAVLAGIGTLVHRDGEHRVGIGRGRPGHAAPAQRAGRDPDGRGARSARLDAQGLSLSGADASPGSTLVAERPGERRDGDRQGREPEDRGTGLSVERRAQVLDEHRQDGQRATGSGDRAGDAAEGCCAQRDRAARPSGRRTRRSAAARVSCALVRRAPSRRRAASFHSKSAGAAEAAAARGRAAHPSPRTRRAIGDSARSSPVQARRSAPSPARAAVEPAPRPRTRSRRTRRSG